ncbi:MAG: SPOR domain-containing protein, partial [Burkholderiaceae bacterium]|nr:SPOR domain-containing protein [Burkholderiaceae bacterium]
IPIDIPDRNKVAPLVVPAPTAVADAPSAKTDAKPAAVAPAGASAAAKVVRNGSVSGGLAEGEELVSGPTSSSPKSNAVVATTTKTETKTPAKTEPKPKPKPEPEPKPELRAQVKPESKPEPKPEPNLPIKPDNRSDTKAVPHTDEAARARALLEGRSVPTAGSEAEDSRFIVQVGAFADADKAREVRAKVERAGMKTYTQVVDTKDGKRTRVRVGPFANRVEADKAVARIKGLDLPASVLAL